MAAKKWMHCMEQKERELILKALIDPGYRMKVLRYNCSMVEMRAGDDILLETDNEEHSPSDIESQIEAIADELLFACTGPRGRA